MVDGVMISWMLDWYYIRVKFYGRVLFCVLFYFKNILNVGIVCFKYFSSTYVLGVMIGYLYILYYLRI